MAAVMNIFRSLIGGQWVAQCPECKTLCPSWDADDLNEDGLLVCHCEGVDRGEA